MSQHSHPKHHHAKGGRVMPDHHKPEHFHEIETPFHEHDGDSHGPHHGSHPDHYLANHGMNGHVRKHFHGK